MLSWVDTKGESKFSLNSLFKCVWRSKKTKTQQLDETVKSIRFKLPTILNCYYGVNYITIENYAEPETPWVPRGEADDIFLSIKIYSPADWQEDWLNWLLICEHLNSHDIILLVDRLNT